MGSEYAGMVELADTLDLGSSGSSVQVQVLLPAPSNRPLLIQFVSLRVGYFFNCACLLDILYDIVATPK